MRTKRRKFEIWSVISLFLLAAFLLFFVYPICTLLRQAFVSEGGSFTLANFAKFFSKKYYYGTILNSFKPQHYPPRSVRAGIHGLPPAGARRRRADHGEQL